MSSMGRVPPQEMVEPAVEVRRTVRDAYAALAALEQALNPEDSCRFAVTAVMRRVNEIGRIHDGEFTQWCGSHREKWSGPVRPGT